ncbi:unnamed protein product, partial [Vitis vinifera]
MYFENLSLGKEKYSTLFSIILFLLFYLFYLKRRASTPSSTAPMLPRSMNQAASFLSLIDLKGELKGKLPTILFDEELKARDSQCCVCLGEFEIKEEYTLHQIPSCKHEFPADCIYHWLRTNSTCPICRCSVFPNTKGGNPVAPVHSNKKKTLVLGWISLILPVDSRWYQQTDLLARV